MTKASAKAGTGNIFASAKTVDAPAPAPKAKKGEKLEVKFGSELDQYAAIDAVIKTCTGLKETLGGLIKEQNMTTFVGLTVKHGKRPDNFTGVSDKATASMELRAKGQKLNDEERKALDELKVPYHENVISETHERFFFNPALLADQAMMEKISRALTKIPELEGVDIVLKQEEARVVEYRVDETTFDAIARLGNLDQVRKAYDSAATLAIKPKVNSSDKLDKALGQITELLNTVAG